jgi:SAM-dependent methyltransferase
MKIKKRFLKFLMLLFSRINHDAGPWQGYAEARLAANEEEKTVALLKISYARYEESKEFPIENIFKVNFKNLLQGKDLLEIGSNHGGASYCYFEQFCLKSITGIDTSDIQAKISELFFKRKGVKSNFHFQMSFAENLPFPDESFDAILSFDVFEHVQNVLQTLNECYRVLRVGGKAFIAFHGYYHPFGHHFNIVTGTPFIHWFFSPKLLMEVYYDILEDYPEYSYKNHESRRPLEPWEKLQKINGTTLSSFCSLIKQQPWRLRKHVPYPIGAQCKTCKKYPFLKTLKYLFLLGTRIPILREFCNHRIVYILEK